MVVRCLASSAPWASARFPLHPRWSARALLHFWPRTRTSDGDPAHRSGSAKTHSSSHWGALHTRSDTASCCRMARQTAVARGGFWSGPRKAWEYAGIGRFKAKGNTLEAFYLDRDELHESDTGHKTLGRELRAGVGGEHHTRAELPEGGIRYAPLARWHGRVRCPRVYRSVARAARPLFRARVCAGGERRCAIRCCLDGADRLQARRR